ncbi:MAG: alpha/beta hydrolase [Chloroflexi bacterium]|nr:alpha/beta hydrolase [Chloroflexota bacterium]
MAKTIEMWIEEHKLVARAFNEDQPGTPIVFLHGITSSVDFWEPLLPQAFRQSRRWYALSLPGHYPATMPPRFREEDLTAEMIARVLSEALYRLCAGQPLLLIGHSTGGFAALHLAEHAPGIVKGVASISGFAQGKWGGMLGLNQKIAALPVVGNGWFKSAYWLIGRSLSVWVASLGIYAADGQAMRTHPAFLALTRSGIDNYRRLDLDTMAMYFRRMPHIDISQQVAQIRAPLLLIAGDKDAIVPPTQSQMIAQQVAGSELHILAGAGHVPMLERAAEYDRILFDWLDRHG